LLKINPSLLVSKDKKIRKINFTYVRLKYFEAVAYPITMHPMFVGYLVYAYSQNQVVAE